MSPDTVLTLGMAALLVAITVVGIALSETHTEPTDLGRDQ